MSELSVMGLEIVQWVRHLVPVSLFNPWHHTIHQNLPGISPESGMVQKPTKIHKYVRRKKKMKIIYKCWQLNCNEYKSIWAIYYIDNHNALETVHNCQTAVRYSNETKGNIRPKTYLRRSSFLFSGLVAKNTQILAGNQRHLGTWRKAVSAVLKHASKTWNNL